MVGNQIARNIKFFRLQNDWTQDDLAEKLLTSRSAVSKWEGNIYTPDIHSLVKLTKIFKISLEDLVSLESFQYDIDILKDSRLKYTTEPDKFDHEVSQIVEYIFKNPTLKHGLFRMQSLPIRKQKSLQSFFKNVTLQYQQLYNKPL